MAAGADRREIDELLQDAQEVGTCIANDLLVDYFRALQAFSPDGLVFPQLLQTLPNFDAPDETFWLDRFRRALRRRGVGQGRRPVRYFYWPTRVTVDGLGHFVLVVVDVVTGGLLWIDSLAGRTVPASVGTLFRTNDNDDDGVDDDTYVAYRYGAIGVALRAVGLMFDDKSVDPDAAFVAQSDNQAIAVEEPEAFFSMAAHPRQDLLNQDINDCGLYVALLGRMFLVPDANAASGQDINGRLTQRLDNFLWWKAALDLADRENGALFLVTASRALRTYFVNDFEAIVQEGNQVRGEAWPWS